MLRRTGFGPKVVSMLMTLIMIVSLGVVGTVSVQADAIFDNCDSTTGWASNNNVVVDTSDKQEGSGSLSATGTGAVFFQKILSTPIDSDVDLATGALSMWLYVSDVTEITGGQIEITSAGTSDSEELSWSITNIGLVNGWNEVELPLADATPIGTIDLSQIDFFRVYDLGTDNTTMKVDKVEFITIVPPAPSNLFDDCDDTAGWISGNTLSLDTADYKEGTGSLSATGTGPVFFQKTLATPYDTGINTWTGALSMWLYVSDASELAGGQIEICSGGAPDNEESSWAVENLELVDGWNKLFLKMEDANIAVGGADLSKINFIRIYDVGTTNITMKIDALEFVSTLSARASDDSLQFSVKNDMAGTKNYYAHQTFSTASYTFQAGDYLEYDVYLHEEVDGAGGIDVTMTDGSNLRDNTGWEDQNDVSGHPAADISEYAYRSWTHRKMAIPASMVGKTANAWRVVGENDDEGILYTATYDNIVVTDGSGNIRKVAFKDLADSNANTLSLTSSTDTTMLLNGRDGSLGGDYIRLDVVNDSSATHYYYNKFSTKSYTFEEGDVLHYKVKILDDVAGAGGIDCITTDGTNLRDQVGWEDTEGLNGHPNTDISSIAYDSWYIRKLEIPASMVGKTVDRWDVVGGATEANLSYSALFDDVFILNSSGRVKEDIFRNAWDSDVNAADVWVLGATATMSFTDSEGNVNTPSAVANPRVMTTVYPTEDIVIASYDVTDAPYSADKTGVSDATDAIQDALTDAFLSGGGTVYMPAGKYKITSNLTIPANVSLRGDWQDPDVGTNYGTVIVANVPSGVNEYPGLINVQGNASINGLTVYYPNQSASNPVVYPYTFVLNAASVDGPMSSTLRNVTMLNAYKGITTGHLGTNSEMHNIMNVKGTVLKNAVQINSTSDVGRLDRLTFNNSYWVNAGAAYNAPSQSTLDTWTRANGVGIEITDTEWENFVDVSLSDYKVGIHLKESERVDTCGIAFNVSIENANVALLVDAVDTRVGMSFTNSTFEANQGSQPVAIEVNNQSNSSIIFNSSTFFSTGAIVNLTTEDLLNFQNCTFDAWSGSYAITADAGSIVSHGSTFSQTLTSGSKGIALSGTASGSLLGNVYTGSSSDFLGDTSSGDVKWQDSGYTFSQLSVTEHTRIAAMPKPSVNTLYDVTKAPYNADTTGVTDATSAIQSALDAAAVTGGTVYLPSGEYRINTNLTVPAGVELRGTYDAPHRGVSRGTVLSIYEGHNTQSADTATAAVTLNGTGAGIKGVTFYYPNMPNTSSTGFLPYPYAIRGNGSDVYAMNITFINAYNGLDFATNKNDGHYISAVDGCTLNVGINVGGGSDEGWVENSHHNATYWTRTDFPNRILELYIFDLIFPYTRNHQHTFMIGDTGNEHLMNNFVYGPNTGFNYYEQNGNGPTATAINSGVDGSTEAYRIDGTSATGVTLINSEACGVKGGTGDDALEIGSGTVYVYGFISMEGNDLAIRQTGGTLYIQGAMFHHKEALLSAGTAIWNGLFFKDTGNNVTVNSGVTGSGFWGNIGEGGFTYVNDAGSGADFSDNIGR